LSAAHRLPAGCRDGPITAAKVISAAGGLLCTEKRDEARINMSRAQTREDECSDHVAALTARISSVFTRH
jgi:hypothetical protein